jgi:hypothetical protein
MCGAPKTQEVVQRVELDPALQRLLYGGTIADPRGGFGSRNQAAGGGSASIVDGGMGGGSDNSPMWSDGMSPAQIDAERASGRFGSGQYDSYGGGRPSSGGFSGSTSDYMAAGGMYAMGGMVQPQQGLASLNQGQMPMMNGGLPNLSDPMTAATLAMAMRGPQMQYGDIMAPQMPQQGFAMGGYVEGPGTGTSDSIDAVIMQNGRPVQEALLSDGEFVMTERAVRGAGNGDRDQGAARMYEMMRQFERGGRV